MGMFPALRTGAVAQYPTERSIEFATQVLWFVDGGEQRFAEHAGPLRRWVVRLDLLDESELETLGQFFENESGRAGTFSFTDPWDGTVYANCSFDSDDLELMLQSAARGNTQVVVKENRT